MTARPDPLQRAPGPPRATRPTPSPDAETRRVPHASALLLDRRGFTAAGAVVVLTGAGIAGEVVDLLRGVTLGGAFAVLFVLGAALCALRVHREDLVASVVMPPLVYVLVALLSGSLHRAGVSGSVLSREAFAVLNAVVIGAPALLLATALAASLAAYRHSRAAQR